MALDRPSRSPWSGAGGAGRLQVRRGMNRRYGSLARLGSMPMTRHGWRDATGGAQQPPLPRWCDTTKFLDWGSTAHILRAIGAKRFGSEALGVDAQFL